MFKRLLIEQTYLHYAVLINQPLPFSCFFSISFAFVLCVKILIAFLCFLVFPHSPGVTMREKKGGALQKLKKRLSHSFGRLSKFDFPFNWHWNMMAHTDKPDHSSGLLRWYFSGNSVESRFIRLWGAPLKPVLAPPKSDGAREEAIVWRAVAEAHVWQINFNLSK